MKYSYFICEQFSALVQQVKITQTFNITFFSFFLMNAINIRSFWVSSIYSVIALPVNDIMKYNQAEELNKAPFW